ncbi:flippase-like domain-containing protein [Patescibacteria group bacterium]|nr:flippase-like domain-containing protein [Patescibacteria group bacterium]
MIKKILKNKWFFRLIGIVIFIFILNKINLKETLSFFLNLNLSYLVLAILIMVFASTIKPYRWQYILKTMNINYSFWQVFRLYFIGLFMGIVTPGRLGELGKIIYLKKNNHSFERSLASIMIDRLADIFYLIISGFIGLFLFFYFFKNLIIIGFSIITIGIILFIIIIKIKKAKIILKRLIFILVPKKYKQKIEKSFSEFIENIKLYKFKNYFKIFILTTLSWLVSYVAVYFLTKSIGMMNVSFIYLTVSITIVSLVTLLPISISGLGTREATFLMLFIPLGFTNEQIISLSLLIFITNFIIIPIIGLSCWLITPITTNIKNRV